MTAGLFFVRPQPVGGGLTRATLFAVRNRANLKSCSPHWQGLLSTNI